MIICAAIHGIMTGQTDASWPDKFRAWMFHRDPSVQVMPKEYAAGPFPRWNVWVKDPRIARGLTAELRLMARAARATLPRSEPIDIWLVAHSNGGVIAMQTAKRLIAEGSFIAGLILTGAAVDADVEKNGICDWMWQGRLKAAIAYASEDDAVVAGDASVAPLKWKVRDWVWGKLMWPYGCLGRTGWMVKGEPYEEGRMRSSPSRPRIFTRWFKGGHSSYFAPQQINGTFDQFYEDMTGGVS